MKDNRKLSNLARFTIVIMVMFMSIISIELITVIYSEKIDSDYIKRAKLYTPGKKGDDYDTSKLKFNYINIDLDEKYQLTDCKNGCNINAIMYDMDYKYIFTKEEGEYKLTLVKDEHILLDEVNLGSSLEKAYFRNYMNYLLFYNEINDGYYVYDYVNIVDNIALTDEFSSLSNREMKFTDDGIIYYYDVCHTEKENHDRKIKAIRKPYDDEPKVISTEPANFDWCQK